MKRALSKMDKIIILCKNVERSSSVYCETLGLRVFLQSKQFVELRDASNMAIYLQESRSVAQLSKGYSPILSFNVQNFDQVHQKLLRYELIPDGEIVSTAEGKIAAFLGLDGQTISINSIQTEDSQFASEERDSEENVENDQIKRILSKIKL